MSLPESILDLSVLIVDDKSNMRRTIKNILRKAGFTRTLEAEDGDTALERIRYSKVDLILLDWNMPRMKGIEVLRELRAREKYRDLMVLMVTGEEQQATVAEAIEGTVDHYLTKPFTPERLLDRIKLLWDSRTNPTKIDLHLKKGWNHLEREEGEEALAEFKLALFENPQSPRTYHSLGRAYDSLKDPKKAKAHYQQAVEMAPQFLMAHVDQAELHEKQGELAEAAASLEKAIRINPNNLDRRIKLGQILIKQQEKARALEIFSKVIERSGETDVDIVTKVGDALLEAGMGAEAEGFLSRGLSNVPGAVILKNRLGIAFRIQGKYKEAIDNYRSALKESPDDENLLYNLGRAYHDDGQEEKAALIMKQAIRINPDFAAAKQFLVKVLGVKLPDGPGGFS
jgi:two-component system chemotaxis response regulator CheY